MKMKKRRGGRKELRNIIKKEIMMHKKGGKCRGGGKATQGTGYTIK